MPYPHCTFLVVTFGVWLTLGLSGFKATLYDQACGYEEHIHNVIGEGGSRLHS